MLVGPVLWGGGEVELTSWQRCVIGKTAQLMTRDKEGRMRRLEPQEPLPGLAPNGLEASRWALPIKSSTTSQWCSLGSKHMGFWGILTQAQHS